jgi:hypothetical protein
VGKTIAAIRSGSEPVGKLPPAAFHKWLEEPLRCSKCDVIYNLVADWDWAVSRWFPEESRGPIRMLKKAVQMGHGSDHRVTHLESSGVVVLRVTADGQS